MKFKIISANVETLYNDEVFEIEVCQPIFDNDPTRLCSVIRKNKASGVREVVWDKFCIGDILYCARKTFDEFLEGGY